MKKILIASILLSGSFAFAAEPTKQDMVVSQNVEQQIDEMLYTMKERLVLMSDIAKWKWNNAQPIENTLEENSTLDEMCADCEKHGLDKGAIKAFFMAQFRASKMIQINHFEEWVKKDFDDHESAADFKKTIKPKLAQLNNKLIRQMKELSPHLKDKKYRALLEQRASEILQGDKIDDQVRKAALEPLQ